MKRSSFLYVLVFLLSLPAMAAWEGVDEALQAYEEARGAALQASTPEARAALQASARDALETARSAYEGQGIEESLDPEAVMGYAGVLRELGDADLAVESLERITARYPEDGASHLALAEAAREMGPAGAEKAMTAAQQARFLAGDDTALRAQAQGLLAMLYWDAELFTFAREHLDGALAGDGTVTEWRIYDAALLAREGLVVEAWAILEDLGREVQPYDALARTLFRKALWDFDKMRRTVPDTAEAHGAYGRLLYQSGRLPDAVLALRRGASLAPENTELWNILGAIHSQLGSLDQAIQSYEASLKADGNQPQVQGVLQQLRAAQAQQAQGAAQP